MRTRLNFFCNMNIGAPLLFHSPGVSALHDIHMVSDAGSRSHDGDTQVFERKTGLRETEEGSHSLGRSCPRRENDRALGFICLQGHEKG